MVQLRMEFYHKGTHNKFNVMEIEPFWIQINFGDNAYGVKLPKEYDILCIFDVVELYQYKEKPSHMNFHKKRVLKYI